MRWAFWDVSSRGPEISVIEADSPEEAWQKGAGELEELEQAEYNGGLLWRGMGDQALSDVSTEQGVAKLAKDLWTWWRDCWGQDPPVDAEPPSRYWPSELGEMPPERETP